MKKSVKFLFTIALLFLAVATVKPALSYFTTYTELNGASTMHASHKTVIHENVEKGQKHIQVENTGELPVVVRVLVFSPVPYDFTGATPWVKGGNDEFFYEDVLEPGETSSSLDLSVTVTTTGEKKVPDEVKELSDFNVIVVYESQPVTDGITKASEAKWPVR